MRPHVRIQFLYENTHRFLRSSAKYLPPCYLTPIPGNAVTGRAQQLARPSQKSEPALVQPVADGLART